MKEYIVSQEEKGKRLDTYIPSVDTDITRTSAQRLIEDGNILVNGKNAKIRLNSSVQSNRSLHRSAHWNVICIRYSATGSSLTASDGSQ